MTCTEQSPRSPAFFYGRSKSSSHDSHRAGPKRSIFRTPFQSASNRDDRSNSRERNSEGLTSSVWSHMKRAVVKASSCWSKRRKPADFAPTFTDTDLHGFYEPTKKPQPITAEWTDRASSVGSQESYPDSLEYETRVGPWRRRGSKAGRRPLSIASSERRTSISSLRPMYLGSPDEIDGKPHSHIRSSRADSDGISLENRDDRLANDVRTAVSWLTVDQLERDKRALEECDSWGKETLSALSRITLS